MGQYDLTGICPIHDEASYSRMVALADALIESGLAGKGRELSGLFGLVSSLIANYDDEHHPVPSVTPREMLRFLMDQHRLTQKDLPEDLAGKHVVLDILAEDTDGKRFGVEMQLQHFLHWPQRNIYVVSRALADQLQSGQHYRNLQPVIGISLLAHDLFHDWPSKATWHFTLRDSQLHKVQLDGTLQIHLIELRKADRLGQLPPALSDWIACLLHNLDEAAMNQITHPPVKDALSHLDALYSDEELRLVIQRRQQALMDEQDALAWATNDGEKRGEERGLKKGRQAGKQEGAAHVLERMLTRKFGPLAESVRQRLRQADADILDAWSLNFVDAKTLDDVFRQ